MIKVNSGLWFFKKEDSKLDEIVNKTGKKNQNCWGKIKQEFWNVENNQKFWLERY